MGNTVNGERVEERGIPFYASRSPSKSENTNLHYMRRLYFDQVVQAKFKNIIAVLMKYVDIK